MFEIFNIILTYPITNLLALFYHLLFLVHIPYAFGFSIILVTVFIRALLYPFVSSYTKSSFKMQKLAPHMAAIRERHKGDSKRQQEETMKLYREHGVNPAAGCLPMLIQIPVTISLYRVLTNAVNITSTKGLAAINKVLYVDFIKLQHIWDTTFLGLPLGSTPAKLFAHQPYLIIVPILTGALQFVLSKMMLPEPELVPAVTEKKSEDDFQSAFQKQSMFLFPVMIGYFSFIFPIGLSLYWNAFTIFGILQQYIVVGAGSAAPYFKKIKSYGRKR